MNSNKREANRKNALKSTGPKTARGKQNSRTNAIRHGVYCKELLVSEADKAEIQQLRAALEADLKPDTTSEWLAFDSYVVSCWRCKLAARFESRQFARQLQDEQPENGRGESPTAVPVIEGWYGSSPREIHAGIKALESARGEFEANWFFHEATKSFLIRGFGAAFLRTLEDWTPTISKDAILLADTVIARREDFGEIPGLNDKAPSMLGKERVLLDPTQCQRMVSKLLEERMNFLQELLIIGRHNGLHGNERFEQSLEFNPRFLTDANRESRRALSWYLELKEKNR